MTNSTDTYLSVDGVSLQTYAFNIETWGSDREAPPSMRGGDTVIPYMPGAQWNPRTVDSRVISLGMWVVGAEEDGSVPASFTMRQEFEKNWKMLRKLLWNPKKQIVLTKRFRLPGDAPGVVRTASAKAQFAGGLNPKMNGELRAVFTVDLLLSDPYFYGDQETVLLDPQRPLQEIEVLGDAPTNDIEITLNGFSKRLRMTNETEDHYFEYNRELPAGRKALLDVKNFDATHDITVSPVPSSGSVDNVGDPFWMFLMPGEQQIGIQELDVPSRGSVWTNKFTNPSMETPGTTQTVFTNLDTNPGQRQVKAAVTPYRTNLLISPNAGLNTTNQVGPQTYGLGANTGTNSRVATGGVGGTGYYRKTWTNVAGGASLDVGFYIGQTALSATRVPVLGSQVYTASGFVRRGGTVAANFPLSATIYWFDAAGANIGTASGAAVSVGTTFARASVTATAPKNAVTALFLLSNLTSWLPAVGTTLDVTAPLFEAADTVRPFFCGITPDANGYVTAWTGTVNNSVSEQRATQVEVYRNLVTNPGMEFPTGANTRTNQATNPRFEAVPAVTNYARDPSGKAVTSGLGGYWWATYAPQAGGSAPSVATGGPLATCPTYVNYSSSGVTADRGLSHFTDAGVLTTGKTYNFSMYVRSSTALAAGAAELRVAAGPGAYVQLFTGALAANTWTRWSGTYTVPDGSVSRLLFFNAINVPTTTAMAASAVQITEGTTLWPFFNGGFTSDAAFTYSWLGNADQSSSLRLDTAGITAGYEQYDNLNPNPSIEGPATTTTIATNIARNPSLVTAGAVTTLRTNLCNNPAGGTNATGYTANASGTITRVTGENAPGVAAATAIQNALTAAAASAWGIDIGNATGPMNPVTPGTTYSFLSYVKTSVAFNITYRVTWYNGATLLSVSGLTTFTTTANTWTIFAGIATAPATATRAVIQVLAPSGAIGNTIRVSGTIMEASPVVTSYFDGGSTSPIAGEYTIGWTGTAHASTSVMTAPTATPFPEAPSAPTGAWISQSSTLPTGAVGLRSMRLRSSPVSGSASYVVWDLSYLAAGTYTVRFLAQFTGTPGANATANTGYLTFGSIDIGSASIISDQMTLNTTAQWVTINFTVPASGDRFLVMHHDMASGSPDLLMDNFLLVSGTWAEDLNYFDGSSSPTAPWQVAWSGTANASSSILTAATPNGYSAVNGSLFRDFSWVVSGGYGARLRGRKLGTSYARLSSVPLTPGQTYTAVVTTRISSVLTSPVAALSRKLGIETNGVPGSWNATYAPVNVANNVAEQRMTFTAPAGTSYVIIGHGSNVTPANDVWFDNFLLTPIVNTSAPYLDEYFDGNTGSLGEYVAGWVGAEAASASFLRAPKIVGYGSSIYSHGFASTLWASSGSTSLRIRPNASGTASYAYADGDAGTGMRSGLQAGKSYTVIAKIRLTAPQTGTLDYRARRFIVFSRIGTAAYTEVLSNQAPNAAGVTELRATFTIPVGTTDAFIRLYNGAPDAGRETNNVWYDDLAIIEVPSATSPYVEPYFDGTTAPWQDVTSVIWNGTPDASTSSRAIAYAASYGGESGSGTGFSSTFWSKTGQRSLRIVPTSTVSNDSYANPGSNDMGALRLGMVAGGTYTLLATRYVPTALTGTLNQYAYRAVVVYKIGAGAFQVFVSAVEADYTGTKDIRLNFTLPAGTTEATVRLYNGAFSEGGDVYWDNVALIANPVGSEYVGDYFDGDTAMFGPYAPFWDGARGIGVQSVVRAPAIAGTTFDTTRVSGVDVQDFLPGTETPANRVRATGTNNSYSELLTQATLAPSTSYLIRGKITLTAPQTGTLHANARKIVAVNTAQATINYEQVVPNAAGTYEYVARITTGPGAFSGLRAYNGGAFGSPDVYWTDVMIVAGGDETIPFFDGLTPNGTDWSYAWTGTADASTSIQTALGVASLTASTSGVPISSTVWSQSRGKSVRVFPKSTVNTSYISVNGDSGAMRLGMVAGKTYTIVATCHLEAQQSGSLSPQARRLYVGILAGGVSSSFQTEQAPNAAGTYEQRLTFTLPANTTQAWVRPYNGAALGGGDVYWDDFALLDVEDEAHAYVGPYFDGSTPDTDYADYEWTGATDASTSIIKGVAATEDIVLKYRPAYL